MEVSDYNADHRSPRTSGNVPVVLRVRVQVSVHRRHRRPRNLATWRPDEPDEISQAVLGERRALDEAGKLTVTSAAASLHEVGSALMAGAGQIERNTTTEEEAKVKRLLGAATDYEERKRLSHELLALGRKMTAAGRRARPKGRNRLPNKLNGESNMEEWPTVIMREMSSYMVEQDWEEWNKFALRWRRSTGKCAPLPTRRWRTCSRRCRGTNAWARTEAHTSCCKTWVRSAAPSLHRPSTTD